MWDAARQQVEESFFEILFVMTEVVGGPSNFAFQKTLFLFWIDLGQVFRVMTSPVYGWSEESYNLTKNMDLVYVLATLVSKVVPRYSLFIFAQFLVLLALGDAFYAAKLFKGGAKVQTMWPIKLLRFLVGSVVTILFSSVLKWLIIPIDCQVSKEKSLSSYFHGEDAPCTPWVFPEIVFSTVAVLSAVAYMSFAIIVSLLAFETNALARGVRASSTGRVEAWWIGAKVAVTFMAYLVQWLRAISCAAVLLLLMLMVLYQHITLLPFHRHETNLIRGGVFFFVCWLALATVIVAAADVSQTQEWALIALAPVFFALGVCFTHWIRRQHDRSIERLRAEFLQIQSHSENNSSQRKAAARGDEEPVNDAASFARFYDPTWESRKAFSNPASAKVMLRTLLYRRERQDVDFLLYSMDRAIQEYPDSIDLRIFELLLVRFIKQDSVEAMALEKRYKSEKKKLPLDYRYVLFAFEKKTMKNREGADLGKGKFTVINVMEFNAGMDRSRRAHMQCITALRKFWSSTKHLKSADRHEVMLEEMLKHLHSVNAAIKLATSEYASLVELYPTSVTLLHTYAHFCETILNDAPAAAVWRAKAETLEELSDADGSTGGMSVVDEEDGGGGEKAKKADARKSMFEDEHDGGKSSVSGFSASGKTVLERNLILWRDLLLKDEMLTMKVLHRRVKVGVLIMLCTAAAGYTAMNHVLLSDMATANINSIDSTLRFAGWSVMTMYLMRDQEVAARSFDESRTAHDIEQVIQYMNELKAAHYLNFEHLPSRSIVNFYTGEKDDYLLHFNEPYVAGWKRADLNFWDGITAWVHRVKRAVHVSSEELREETFSLADISDEKRNVAFVFENTIHEVLPTYETLLHLYQEEVLAFVRLANTMVYITACLNAFLTLVLSSFVIWMVRRVVPKLQCKRTCVHVALRFPRKCQSKLRSFYQDLEHKMEELEEGLQMDAQDPDLEPEARGERYLTGNDGGAEGPGQLPQSEEGQGFRRAPSLPRVESFLLGAESEEPPLPHARASFKLLRRTGSNGSGGGGLGVMSKAGSFRAPAVDALPEGPLSALTAQNVSQHIAHFVALDSGESFRARGSFRVGAGEEAGVFSGRRRGEDSPVLAAQEQQSSDFVQRAIRGFRLDHQRSFRATQGASFFQRNSAADPEHAQQSRRRAPFSSRGGSPVSPRVRRGSRAGGDDFVYASASDASPRRSPVHDPSPVARSPNYKALKVASWIEDNTGLFQGSPTGTPLGGARPRAATEDAALLPQGGRGGGRGGLRFKLSSEMPALEGTGSPGVASGGPPVDVFRVTEKLTSFSVEAADTEGRVLLGGCGRSPELDTGNGERGMGAEGEGEARAGAQGSVRPEGVDLAVEHEAGGGSRKVSIIKFDLADMAEPAAEDLPLSQLPQGGESPLPGPVVRVSRARAEDPSLQLTEVGDGITSELDKMMVKHRFWHSRAATWFAAMILMAGFCVFATMYPMRVLPDLQDMAPLVDHGGRRGYMMQECVFLARELVLDDGYSRMDATEITLTLDKALQRLRREHDAVRLGGDHGIRVGADLRFTSHNKVMYEPGCIWRSAEASAGGGGHRRASGAGEAAEEEEECSFGGGHEDAARNGLNHLVKTFFDAVEAVLDKWGPPGWREAELEGHAGVPTPDPFAMLHSRPERLVAVDEELQFLEMAFKGDLLQGLNYVQDLFHVETHRILDRAHLENELCFIFYVLAIVGCWYGILFRSVSKSAAQELNRARDFVSRLPMQVMTTKEMNCIGSIFLEHSQDNHEDKPAESEGRQ